MAELWIYPNKNYLKIWMVLYLCGWSVVVTFTTVLMLIWPLKILMLFGAIWSCLEPFGAIWSHLELFGSIWRHLKSFGAILSYLDPFGAI